MNVPSWAVTGAKVVCVVDEWSQEALERYGIIRVPMNREVLTISAVVILDGICGLQFVEIDNGDNMEGGWNIVCFHPVAPQRTEVEDVAMIKDLIGIKTEERV